MALINQPKLDAYQRGSIATILFGLIFFAAGSGVFFFFSVPALTDWAAMKHWQPGSATVINVELETNHGDDSTTYKVVANYRYNYNGIEFTGHRVGLVRGSDNIGSWHQDTYHRLRANNITPVWINPDHPDQSIIDREMRWGHFLFSAFFLLVFGGVGTGVMVMGWHARSQQNEIDSLEGEFWQISPRWKENRILSNAKSGMLGLWFFAGFWNLISSSVFFIIHKELSAGNLIVLAALIFPLVGVGLLIWAIRATQQWKRFGKTPLILDPFPGELSDQVGGRVELNGQFQSYDSFTITLSCVNKRQVRSGKSTRTDKTVLWQDAKQVAAKSIGFNQWAIEFGFRPPMDLSPTSGGTVVNGIIWEVSVDGETTRGKLDRQWEIPVIVNQTRSGQSSLRSEETNEKYTNENRYDYLDHTDIAEVPIPESIVVIERDVRGTRFYYPMLRSKMAFIGIAVGGLFLGIGMAPILNEIPLFMRIIFSGLGGLCLIGSIYAVGNSLEVLIDQAGITSIRNVLGISFSRRVNKNDILSINYRITRHSSSSNRTTPYYSVFAVTADNRKITLGESLNNIGMVNQIIEKISKALGPKQEIPVNVIKNEFLSAKANLDPATVVKIRKIFSILSFLVFAGFIYFSGFGKEVFDLVSNLILNL